MKQLFFTLLAIFTATFGFSQAMPKQSPAATVSQTVGLNELSISYSRPSANGRVIFGDVVPFNEVWRLGANACTKLTFSRQITINNQTLEAGTYAVFAIPTKNQWKIAFNTNTEQWGSGDYDPAKNVLEYTTPVAQGAHTETMSIGFEAILESSANIVIRWADAVVAIPFSTDTQAAVKAEIEAALAKGENLVRVHYNAADYFMDMKDLESAKMHLDKSLAIEKTYYNVFLQAQMIAEEDPKEALKLAAEAIEMAKKADKQSWADYMVEKSADWK